MVCYKGTPGDPSSVPVASESHHQAGLAYSVAAAQLSMSGSYYFVAAYSWYVYNDPDNPDVPTGTESMSATSNVVTVQVDPAPAHIYIEWWNEPYPGGGGWASGPASAGQGGGFYLRVFDDYGNDISYSGVTWDSGDTSLGSVGIIHTPGPDGGSWSTIYSDSGGGDYMVNSITATWTKPGTSQPVHASLVINPI
jgi:hypothetical protein